MRLFSFVLFVLALSLALHSGSAAATAFKFLSNKACMECHKEIYESWSKSVHAKVFDVLKPGARPKAKLEAGLKADVDYSLDKSCMECHVTGWEQGTFSIDNPNDDWKGIGCEECHGAAEKWMPLHDKKDLKRRDRKLKQAGMKKPFKGKSVCAKCHYHRNTPFRYRDPGRVREWEDPELAKTYHLLKQ